MSNSITLKHIPGLFPTSFSDVVYGIESVRPLPDSKLKVVETDEEFATVHEPEIFTSRTIQVQKFDKYEAIIYCTSFSNLELLKIADELEFNTDEFGTFKARAVSVTHEKLAESHFMYKATVQVYVLQPKIESIFSYLTYPECARGLNENQLNRLNFYCDNLADEQNQWGEQNQSSIVTCLQPTFETSDVDLKEDTIAGVKMSSQSTSFDVINLRFYMNELQARELKKYLPRCWWVDETSGLPKGTQIVLSDNTTYQAVERVIPKITKKNDFIGVWECEIELKYNKLTFNNYEQPII